MNNLFFNFFALGALLPAAFMLFFSIFFFFVKNKSQATTHLSVGYFVLTLFFIAYFVTAYVYQPWAAYHRWVTVPTVLVGIVQIILVGITYYKPVNDKLTKTIMIVGYSMVAILTVLFFVATSSSDIIYHFDGHYYDFKEERISKLVAMTILFWFLSSFAVAFIRFFRIKTQERWPVMLIAVFLVAGPMIPAIFNLLSREGLLDREIYQISQDISTIISYFIVAVVFIDSTKERTPFLTKIMGISLSVLFVFFQAFLYVSMLQQEEAMDTKYNGKTVEIIHMPENCDYNYSYIKIFHIDNQKDSIIKSNVNQTDFPVNFKQQEYVNTFLYHIFFDKKATSLNDQLKKIQLFKNQFFEGHEAVLKKLVLQKNSKEEIQEQLKENKRLLNYTSIQINKIENENFRDHLLEYLPKLKLPEYAPVISNFLNNSVLKGEALKAEVLKFFIPFHSENTRLYRRSINDRTHYLAYLDVDLEQKAVLEVGFPYIEYRQTIHNDSKAYALLILLIIITVMLGYPIFFRNSLMRPIKELLKGLRQLNNGKLDITIPIRVEDEFGIMAHSFNEMASSLHDMTNNLEQKVKERTLEIEMQKEEIKAQADMLLQTNFELEKLSVVASETDNAIAIFDDEENLEWVNHGFTRLYGYTLESFSEKFGKNIFDATATSNIKQIVQSCIDNKESVVYEARNNTINGKFLWVQTTLTPIFDEQHNIKKFIAIDTDITSQKEAEIEIMQRNEEINAQKELLEQRNELIEKQKNVVEEKNKNIRSSLNYARTIQQAILPSQKLLSKYFESFIIFKPKDIVSGDFYWFSEYFAEEKQCIFMAVVDCTGHGVPGAFMSLIGSRMLNTIVNEMNITNPAEVLEEMNKRIRKALNQDESQNTDGMDICLIKIACSENSTKKLTFAGAKRPLYIYNREKDILTTIKGTRRTIGGVNPREIIPFEKHEIEITGAETLYLSTDGLIDQNNKERKRFGSPMVETTIQQVAHLDLEKQKNEFLKALDKYQKTEEQRDDITFIGLRINREFK